MRNKSILNFSLSFLFVFILIISNFYIVENNIYAANEIRFKLVDWNGKPIPKENLKDAKYDLYYIYNGIANKIENNSNITPDDNGKLIFSSVPYGMGDTKISYVIKEVKNPSSYMNKKRNYYVNDVVGYFERKNGNFLENQIYVVNPDNGEWSEGTSSISYNPTGRFVVNKVDEDEQPLEGVIFSLKNSVGVVTDKISNEKGQIIFDNLLEGEYTLSEKEALPNFEKIDDIWKISVANNGKTSISKLLKNKNLDTTLFSMRSIMDRIILETDENILENGNSVLRSATISKPWCQNGGTSNTGSWTYTQQGVTLSQKISPTATKGMYKVDVEVFGSGIVNNDRTDYVIVLEKTKYHIGTPSVDRMYYSTQGYYDRIKQFINYLKQTQPNSKVAVVLADTSVDRTYSFTSVVDLDTAISKINSNWPYNKDDWDKDKDWDVGIIEAKKILDTSDAKNKAIINLTCGGLNYTGIGTNKDEVIMEEALYKDSQGNGSFSNPAYNCLLNQCSRSNIDLYYTAEWGKNGYVYHETTRSIEYYFKQNYKHDAIKDAVTFFNDAGSISPNEITNKYHKTMNSFADKYKNESYGYLNIPINSNVKLLSQYLPNGYTYSNGSIIAKGLKFKTGEKLSFSYYVQSNSEDDNAVFNQLKEINTRPYYLNKADINGNKLNDSLEFQLPIPKVAIPAINVSVNTTWDNAIPTTDRQEWVYLYRNGVKTADWLSVSQNGSQVFNTNPSANNSPEKDYAMFDNSGVDFNYTVGMHRNYKRFKKTITYPNSGTSVTGATGTVNVKFEYDTMGLSFEKKWHYVEENEKTPVTVKLIAKINGVELSDTKYNSLGIVERQKTIRSTDDWQGTFSNLRKYDDSDVEIKYSIQEVGVENQKLDDYDIDVFDDSDKTIISNTKKSPTITVVNERTKRFYLKKVDEKGQPMSGVEFELEDANGIIKKAITNEKGEYEFTGLSVGDYILKETKTLDGYIKTNKIWKVKVKQDGTVSYIEENVESRSFVAKSILFNVSGNVIRSEETPVSSLYPIDNTDPIEYVNAENQIVTVGGSNKGFAKNGTERGKNVINSNKPDDEFFYYSGAYDGKTIDDVAGVNKYAEPTNVEGRFNVNLKVKGNTVENVEDVDIVILYDASRSMNEKNRVKPAYEATKEFVETILSPKNNPNGKYRVALVTYAGDIYDGRYARTLAQFLNGETVFKQATLPNCSHKTFTTNANEIVNRIYNDQAGTWYSDYNNQVWFGGTFTSKGFQEAEAILKTSNAKKKYIVHVTDGIPTKSLVADGYDKDNSMFINFREHNSNPTSYNFDVKGDGTSYYMQYKHNGQSIHDYYAVDGVTVYNHGLIAESYAKKIMLENADTEIFTLGINISEDDFRSYVKIPNMVTKEEAKKVMFSMSTDEKHYYDVDNLNKMTGFFKDIVKKITIDTIQNGEIIDPMGEMVRLNVGGDGVFKEDDFTLYDSDGNTRVNRIVRDKNGKVVLNGTMLHSVTVTQEGEQIKVKGLNIGKDKWIHIKYSVDLRTDHKDYVAGTFYFTNKDTYLKPNGKIDTLWKFPIPAVKGRKDTIIVVPNEPNHFEFEKVNANGELLSGVKFNMWRDNTYVGQYITELDGKIYLSKLKDGHYVIAESEALAGYKKLEGRLIEFDITNGVISNIKGNESILNVRDYAPMYFYLAKKSNENILKNGSLGIKFENSNIFGGTDEKTFNLSTDYETFQNNGENYEGLKIEIPLDLKTGEYVLTEELAPKGYTKIADRFVISVNQENRRISILRIEKSDGSVIDVKETLYTEKELMDSNTTSYQILKGLVPLEIENKKAEYPHTGGRGILSFVWIGGSLMTISFVYAKKKKILFK